MFLISVDTKQNPEKNPAFEKYGWRKFTCEKLEDIAKAIMAWTWSPCVWKEGIRLEDGFVYAQFCALDYDDGELTLEQAKKKYCDMTHIIGTTRSHQKPKGKEQKICDRFRVLLKFEEEITDVKIYRATMQAMLTSSLESADKKCLDGARFFWACNNIVSINAEGDYCQPVCKNLPPEKTPEEKAVEWSKMTKSDLFLSHATIHLLEYGVPKGKRSDACFKACLELFRKGFSREQISEMVFAKIESFDDKTEKKRILDSAERQYPNPPKTLR
jgi:hypothetical protein